MRWMCFFPCWMFLLSYHILVIVQVGGIFKSPITVSGLAKVAIFTTNVDAEN
jgi:hypothetical protein